MDRDIDKRKKTFYNYDQFHVKREKIGELGSQTTKFCCLISNRPILTFPLLYMYDIMIMLLRSGHVTLLRTNFQPRNCPSIGLTAFGGLALGSAPYF